MEYTSLKTSLEFPVEFGSYHIHIWGKPENGSPAAGENSKDTLPEKQFSELKKYYREKYQLGLAALKQVHGKEVVVAPDSSLQTPEADALFTDNKNLALSIRTADCIPVLFFNTNILFFGGIHSGWRGLELQILKSTMDQMPASKQIFKSKTNLVIGPHISKENYETGPDVFKKFPQEFSEPAPGIDKKNLHMKKILQTQISALGFDNSQTIWINENTFQSCQYFSHRSGDTGRNFNIIFFQEN